MCVCVCVFLQDPQSSRSEGEAEVEEESSSESRSAQDDGSSDTKDIDQDNRSSSPSIPSPQQGNESDSDSSAQPNGVPSEPVAPTAVLADTPVPQALPSQPITPQLLQSIPSADPAQSPPPPSPDPPQAATGQSAATVGTNSRAQPTPHCISGPPALPSSLEQESPVPPAFQIPSTLNSAQPLQLHGPSPLPPQRPPSFFRDGQLHQPPLPGPQVKPPPTTPIPPSHKQLPHQSATPFPQMPSNLPPPPALKPLNSLPNQHPPGAPPPPLQLMPQPLPVHSLPGQLPVISQVQTNSGKNMTSSYSPAAASHPLTSVTPAAIGPVPSLQPSFQSLPLRPSSGSAAGGSQVQVKEEPLDEMEEAESPPSPPRSPSPEPTIVNMASHASQSARYVFCLFVCFFEVSIYVKLQKNNPGFT